MRYIFDDARSAYETSNRLTRTEDPFRYHPGSYAQHIQSPFLGTSPLASRPKVDLWTCIQELDTNPQQPNAPESATLPNRRLDSSDEWTGDEEFFVGKRAQQERPNHVPYSSPYELPVQSVDISASLRTASTNHQLDGQEECMAAQKAVKAPAWKNVSKTRVPALQSPKTSRVKSYYRGHISVKQTPRDNSSGFTPELKFHSSSDWTSSIATGSRIPSDASSFWPAEDVVGISLPPSIPSPIAEEQRSSSSNRHGLPAIVKHNIYSPVEDSAAERSSPPSVLVSSGLHELGHWPLGQSDTTSEHVDCRSNKGCPSTPRRRKVRSPASALAISPAVPWSPLSPYLSSSPRHALKALEAALAESSTPEACTPEKPLLESHQTRMQSTLDPSTPPFKPLKSFVVATNKSSDADDENDQSQKDEPLSPLSPDVELHRGPRRHRHSTRFHTPGQSQEKRKRCASYYDEDLLGTVQVSPGKRSHRH